MKQARSVQPFAQVLLAHVDMCYAVALSLTRDPHLARELTLDVVARAWRLRDCVDDSPRIKVKLLTALRERYVEDYRDRMPSSELEVLSFKPEALSAMAPGHLQGAIPSVVPLQ